MNRLILIFFALSALIGSGCEKEEEPASAALPTNLSTVVSINDGVVEIQASAENVNFYTVTYSEAANTTVVESTDGFASYMYTESGTYTVITRAHTTYSDYIEKIDVVDVAASGFVNVPPSSGYETPISYPGYSLVWSDEFEGTALTSDWTFDIGTGSWGWGNNELQNYTNQNYNVGGGYLEIFAKNEGSNYSSTRMKTQGLKSWQYGRIDIRAAMPYGQGIWPALWMLGDSFQSVGWPACGEIDILEMIGGAGANDATAHGTAHWESNGHASYGNSTTVSGGKLADEFHVYSIIWDQNSIKWLLDDVQYNELSITAGDLTEFHQNFFFIFNVAVGGNWPGNPNASTTFPQSMFVDYVRVFQ